MALHFLGLSPTYRQRTDRTLFRRREVLALNLRDGYTSGANGGPIMEAVRRVLEPEGIPFTDSNFRGDKELLRATFRWLNASDEERKKLKDIPLTIVEQLKLDGITTWADVERLAVDSANVAATAAEVPAPPKRLRLAELDGGEQLMALLGQVVPGIEVILDENACVKDEMQQMVVDLADMSARANYAEGMVKLLEDDNDSLEGRLRAARDTMRATHGVTLEAIAVEHPEEPQLLVIAQRLKAAESRGVAYRRELLARFPTEFVWGQNRGGIHYEDRIVRIVADFSDDEQGQAVKQFIMLSEHGPDHPSLHTKKYDRPLPFTPGGSMVSRIADDIRFTWSKPDGGDITVHWVARKSDPRLGNLTQ